MSRQKGNRRERYKCRDCGATVPIDEPAGRGMMNRQVPCPDTPGMHDWVIE